MTACRVKYDGRKVHEVPEFVGKVLDNLCSVLNSLVKCLTFIDPSVIIGTAPANIPATDAVSCQSYPLLQVEMSILPHGAEPVTRQADLLLMLHALVRSQDFVAGAGCVSRTVPPPRPLFSSPLGLSSCYCWQVLPPVLLWTALAIVCPTSHHPIYTVQRERSICS